jgi:hypothetical protein
MSIRGEKYWFIDALDADGGIAFASFRQREEMGGDAIRDAHDEETAVVVTAPDFRPSPVSHRALALGAINRGAQSGVYIGEQELGFASLEQLVEFVRKVYVGGGADGSAPNPGIPPGPEGPRGDGTPAGERPHEPYETAPASQAIASWLMDHADTGEADYRGEPPEDVAEGGRQLIARAAVSIGCALFDRMPYRQDEMESQWRWLTAADQLQQLLGYIDMSAFHMDEMMRWKLISTGSRLISDPRRRESSEQPESEPVEDNHELAWAAYRLIIEGDVTPPFEHVSLLHRYWRYRFVGHDAPRDVFGTLAALPIPHDVAFPKALGPDPSVADFLAYCCATSTVAESSGGTGLLLFAAFCLVAPPRIQRFHFETGGDFRQALFRLIYRDAMRWLLQQFRSTLPGELREQVIGKREA